MSVADDGEKKLTWKERLALKAGQKNKIDNPYFQQFNETFPSAGQVLANNYQKGKKHVNHVKM